jgi:hypothetical protein
LRCHQELSLIPTNLKLCDDKVGIQILSRFDDRFVGVVPKNDVSTDVILFTSYLNAHPAMALNMWPLLRMSVLQVGFQPTVRLGAIVFDRDLTTFVFHERWRDCYCYCYCNAMRSVLNALLRAGHRRYGRRLLLLPSLRTDSVLLAAVVTGDVTAGYSPCRNSLCSLSSNLVLDGGLTCLDYLLAH